ncbi:unnamed protein product, partial [Haemonchus placei]|uniref:DUF1622 domain-containing protein n=1 Tax=Haemonchus placei TaxID=6290 RepID=A0A0N4WDM9_HAEPC
SLLRSWLRFVEFRKSKSVDLSTLDGIIAAEVLILARILSILNIFSDISPQLFVNTVLLIIVVSLGWRYKQLCESAVHSTMH